MFIYSRRYKEMYGDKEPKEFLDSLRYYERAALIDPHSGNAHNQVSYIRYHVPTGP